MHDITCFKCGKKGHKANVCRQGTRTASLEMIDGSFQPLPLSAACITRNTTRRLLLTCSLMHGTQFSHILPDSGAQFSSINKRLVDKYRLQIVPPAASEPSSLSGASSSMRVPRLGYVELPVQVHFPLDSKRQAISVDKKRFEVMEMGHDFIIGVEFLRLLFPRDELLAFAGPHSCITDDPTAASLQVASFLNSCSPSAHFYDESDDESEPRVATASSASPSPSQ